VVLLGGRPAASRSLKQQNARAQTVAVRTDQTKSRRLFPSRGEVAEDGSKTGRADLRRFKLEREQ